MQPQNQKRWTPFTFVWLFLWCLLTVIGYSLLFDSSMAFSDLPPNSYDATIEFGLPFSCCVLSHDPKTDSMQFDVKPLWLIVNIVSIALTMYCIVVASRFWFNKFSIRNLFVLTFMIALLFSIGRAILLTDSFFVVSVFGIGTYFIPIWAAIAAMLRRIALDKSKPNIVGN